MCVRLGAASRRRSAYDIIVPREWFESTQSICSLLWCHTMIVLRAQCRCIRWRHIRFKLAWESKTVTEAEDQTSSTILSAPSCFETLWILHIAVKTRLKCLQSNIALHISTYFVEHLTIIFMCKFRILVLESFMVQGTLNIHCMCMLLK